MAAMAPSPAGTACCIAVPEPHQFEAVAKLDHPSCHECSVLAEAVASGRQGRHATRGHARYATTLRSHRRLCIEGHVECAAGYRQFHKVGAERPFDSSSTA